MTSERTNWRRGRAGGWHCRRLPTRSGSVAGFVREGIASYAFALIGRRRVLTSWQRGFDDAGAAMQAAEQHAARIGGATG